MGAVGADGGDLGTDDGLHGFLVSSTPAGWEEIGRKQRDAHDFRRSIAKLLVLRHEDVVDSRGVMGGVLWGSCMEALPVPRGGDGRVEATGLFMVVGAQNACLMEPNSLQP